MESAKTKPAFDFNRLRSITAVLCLIVSAIACWEAWCAREARAAAYEAQDAADDQRIASTQLAQATREELRKTAQISAKWKTEEERLHPKKTIPNRELRGEAFVRDNPDIPGLVDQAMRALARAWPVQRARKLGFTEAQIQGIIALQEKHRLPVIFNTLDLPGARSSSNDYPDLEALLGEEGARQFVGLSGDETAERLTLIWAQNANDAGAPVTPEQAKAVEQALATAKDSGGQIDWTNIQVPDSVGLSDSQRQVLAAYAAQQTAIQALLKYQRSLEGNRW